jgi:hypothetical protein
MSLIDEYFYDGFLVHAFGKETKFNHTDTITDVCEIISPLIIVTSSLDKIIRMFSLKSKKVIGIFKGHLLGVRQLDYTSF